MIKKVVSGGQTGADIAGLIAAKQLGIPTGGTIPKGFRTLAGPRPEYKELYGLTEHASWAYPPRTECNVRDSDGTICFATVWNSPGEILTKKLIDKHKKPHFKVDPANPPSIRETKLWIMQNDIQILNVAGNSERTSPGIQERVRDYLFNVLSETEDFDE